DTNGDLKDFFGGVANSLVKSDSPRIEALALFPALGFSGAPLPDLQVMGKPVAFGINLWGRGGGAGSFRFSEGVRELAVNAPAFMDLAGSMQNEVPAAIDNLQQLTTQGFTNFSDFNNVNLNDPDSINNLIDDAAAMQQ